MRERKRQIFLILIMTTVSLIVAGITIGVLYNTAFEEERERLVETAQSQARLIEAIARFNAAHERTDPGSYPDGPILATLRQITDAHMHYKGFGETGEFTLARREGDNIVFLLRHRHSDLDKTKPVALDSKLAEPMRRALSGLSGTVVGPDYRGEMVLAAYEPLSELDFGIVAKIDLTEIQAPFVKAGIIAICAAFLVVLVGVFLFYRVSNPIIQHLEERRAKLVRANEKLTREIEERKQAEEALLENEERYRTLLEANPDPVAVYDMEGKVLYLNPTFERVFKWNLEERLGKTMDPFVPEENWSETRMMIDKVLAGESFSGVETRRYTKEGKIIPVSVSGAVYRDKKGNPIGSVVSLRDVSEQKKLEAQLQHAQKMEAVGTLAGGIAHEFNNLLQAVQGYAELLILRRKKGEASYSELQEIVRAAKRGGELSQQLLTFSRKVESNLRPVDLNLEVEKATRLLERTIPKMIKIELHLSQALRPVNADPHQMEQIVLNLALNAKDAMPDGGKLSIATENAILDEEYCRSHTEAKLGQYVLLMVSDTGHGMEKNTLERIFEPFFTTKGPGEGTGIGLAIVYGIVKNHGGHITCSSEPGAGTTFKIYLPAIEHEVQFEKQAEQELLEGGTETILLVDDEDFILDLGKQTFAGFGYTVLTALDGETALEFYRKEQGNIDLVILDLMMPGMSGRECLERLLNTNPKAKVIIASGYSNAGPMKEAIEAGAKSFVVKPYEMKQLLQVAREVLDED